VAQKNNGQDGMFFQTLAILMSSKGIISSDGYACFQGIYKESSVIFDDSQYLKF
jgi:cysteine sulfinate desulfinase/cysteine desulfurase-like protein